MAGCAARVAFALLECLGIWWIGTTSRPSGTARAGAPAAPRPSFVTARCSRAHQAKETVSEVYAAGITGSSLPLECVKKRTGPQRNAHHVESIWKSKLKTSAKPSRHQERNRDTEREAGPRHREFHLGVDWIWHTSTSAAIQRDLPCDLRNRSKGLGSFQLLVFPDLQQRFSGKSGPAVASCQSTLRTVGP